MSKTILTVIAVVSIIVASLIINPTLEAAKLPNTLTEKIPQLDKSPKIIEYQLVSNNIF